MTYGPILFTIQNFFSFPLPVICAAAAAFGAVIGSFLNVVIHRVPREESIVFPNSRCPACGAAIGPFDNIPILSYLILRGHCRNCQASISARYPAVEALTAILFALVAWHDGLTFALPFDLVFVSALLALVFIDAEHMILPNAITYSGLVFALVARVAVPYLVGEPHFDDLHSLATGPLADLPLWGASLVGALIGALAGGGTLWVMGWLWEKIRGVEAMGLGDVKMMFMVGAYLGWRLTVLTIFLAVLSGSLTGIVLMLKQRERNLQMLLPFGVFLGTAGIGALLFGARIVEWYAGQFR
ncbi:MAG: leader peptidase (prepilin peptidase) / N-methyltransferase [Blastocatellia bacterium]|jgi:leader peptidase (prepilin peptidase)/N-methyltransferase|nr:leader peptidase (prepilin peptidase) / N-methyltransferase [Blastocatellia bacterium]